MEPVGRNQHWVGHGLPAGRSFAGGKIIMAASPYGYDDNWPPDAVLSVAMGSDLTGGSSGGPWIIQYGLPGQVAGEPAGTSSTGTTTGSGTPSPRRWCRRTSTAERWRSSTSSGARRRLPVVRQPELGRFDRGPRKGPLALSASRRVEVPERVLDHLAPLLGRVAPGSLGDVLRRISSTP